MSADVTSTVAPPANTGGATDPAAGEALAAIEVPVPEGRTFPSSRQFYAKALIADESGDHDGSRDPEVWWAKRAEGLDWFEWCHQSPDESEAPFYRWSTGGMLYAPHNLLSSCEQAARGPYLVGG
jgi:acetyl-CoA synthetase